MDNEYQIITASKLTDPTNFVRDARYITSLAQTLASELMIQFGARVCYRSVARMDNGEKLIQGCIREKHYDVLEHGHAVFKVPNIGYWEHFKYLDTVIREDECLVGGNLRAWYDVIPMLPPGVNNEVYKMLNAVSPLVFPLSTSSSYSIPLSTPRTVTVGSNSQLLALSGVIFEDIRKALYLNQATFYFDGISRSLTHQLVRHRLASFSQASQRYIDPKKGEWGFITPPSFKLDPEIVEKFEEHQVIVAQFYDWLREKGVRREDARFVLNNSCETAIVTSGNFAMWKHFLKLRRAKDAQWEIRDLADQVTQQLYEVAPHVFNIS